MVHYKHQCNVVVHTVKVSALSVVRFAAVKKRFVYELKELRSREQTQLTNQCIVSLLMGMKFFRVKVVALLLCVTCCCRCGSPAALLLSLVADSCPG